MRLTALTFAMMTCAAAAQTQSGQDCGPRNLAACENSNQLFWGPERHGRAAPRHEFADALNRFLRDAPALYSGPYRFSPASVAHDALMGPGETVHLADGGWFFTGFTPHDAPDQGAVLFDAHGAILAVALLNTMTDAAATGGAAPGPYRLRIYSHDALRQDQRKRFEDWSRRAIDPAGRLGGTGLIRSTPKGWTRLP